MKIFALLSVLLLVPYCSLVVEGAQETEQSFAGLCSACISFVETNWHYYPSGVYNADHNNCQDACLASGRGGGNDKTKCQRMCDSVGVGSFLELFEEKNSAHASSLKSCEKQKLCQTYSHHDEDESMLETSALSSLGNQGTSSVAASSRSSTSEVIGLKLKQVEMRKEIDALMNENSRVKKDNERLRRLLDAKPEL